MGTRPRSVGPEARDRGGRDSRDSAWDPSGARNTMVTARRGSAAVSSILRPLIGMKYTIPVPGIPPAQCPPSCLPAITFNPSALICGSICIHMPSEQVPQQAPGCLPPAFILTFDPSASSGCFFRRPNRSVVPHLDTPGQARGDEQTRGRQKVESTIISHQISSDLTRSHQISSDLDTGANTSASASLAQGATSCPAARKTRAGRSQLRTPDIHPVSGGAYTPRYP